MFVIIIGFIIFQYSLSIQNFTHSVKSRADIQRLNAMIDYYNSL